MALTTKLPNSVKEFFAMPVSDHIDAKNLAANIAETFTPPENAKFVLFSSTGDFYAKYDGSAAEVPDDVDDGESSELNPTMRTLADAGTISVISDVACIVTASYYTK